MTQLFEKHKELLAKAIEAQTTRVFFAGYPEHPKAYGEHGDKEGREAYKSILGKQMTGLGESNNTLGDEVSPYTQKKLDIKYPDISSEDLLKRASQSKDVWRKTKKEVRAGILMESLELFKARFFEVAYATMHTTGQGYMMAFQASGPHAADRALESIATGFQELGKYPEEVLWDKPMGKYTIQLKKNWVTVPKGTSVVIGCSTFPVWNSVPGIYASLITGNPVIVKPHPGAILPIAIVVQDLRNVLKEQGLPEDIVQLAADTAENPKTLELVENPAVKLVDFTGNSAFGSKLEELRDKTVFTEKTGVNSVIIDGASKPDDMAANLAFSVCLYSGQMCTAPQNFFIPKNGISTPDGTLSFEDVAKKITEQIEGLVNNPKAGPFVLGAIQNGATCNRVEDAQNDSEQVLLASGTIDNPMFPDARMMTPAVLVADSSSIHSFRKELFGPVIVLIKTENTDESIALASDLAKSEGAISCACYTLDEDVKVKVMDEMGQAATPVSFNLYGGIYVNQNAGFSDFHVTGGNPAGNASFTNSEFLLKRFTWVGFRDSGL